MTELPRTTAVGHNYLARFATTTVHVYREPAKPGAGVSRAALDRLIRDGLVRIGDYQPLHGKPLIITDLGRSVLDACSTPDAR